MIAVNTSGLKDRPVLAKFNFVLPVTCSKNVTVLNNGINFKPVLFFVKLEGQCR